MTFSFSAWTKLGMKDKARIPQLVAPSPVNESLLEVGGFQFETRIMPFRREQQVASRFFVMSRIDICRSCGLRLLNREAGPLRLH